MKLLHQNQCKIRNPEKQEDIFFILMAFSKLDKLITTSWVDGDRFKSQTFLKQGM